MCAAYGSDLWSMPRYRKPVVHGGPDPASADGRLTDAGMAGDQQYDPIPTLDGLAEPLIDGAPGLVEIVAVEVDDPVRLDRTAFQAAVPATV